MYTTTDRRGRTGYGNRAYVRPAPRPALLDGLLLIVLALIGCVFLWRSLRSDRDGNQAWADVLAAQLMQAIVTTLHGSLINLAR